MYLTQRTVNSVSKCILYLVNYNEVMAYKSNIYVMRPLVRFFDREFYHFIINFRYFIEVTTNFHLFMKLGAYYMP
jgi:hypothetical protein